MTEQLAWNINTRTSEPLGEQRGRGKDKRFTQYTKDGREFIKIWNKGYKDGLQTKLAEKFDITVPTVAGIRKRLKLEPLHSGKHPGRRKFLKSIKKMYWEGKSTLWIAKVKRMSPQGINIALKKMGVKMNEQHCTNPLYFKTKYGPSPAILIKEIKRLYLDEKMNCAEIAKEMWVDQGTVSTKLYAMGIKVLRQNHQPLPGGYKCQWCGKIMETVWQNKGPRKQKYCNSKCGSRAKDFRRLLKGKLTSASRLESMEEFLRLTWKEAYPIVREKLIEVKPLSNTFKVRGA